MAQTVYGDISPRTAAKAAKQMLVRALPYLVLEKFGQSKPLEGNSSKTQTFRRYEALSATPKTVTEGVTPASTKLTKTDVSVTLVQYGDRIELSDVVLDTHEDPILQESTMVLGEQAGIMLETVRYNVLKAGTNVMYANGTARNAVNTPVSIGMQRKATRLLKRQNAKPITTVLKSTADFGTEAVAPAYVGLCHTDCDSDIRDLTGFVPVEKYGSMTPYEGEIGKVENVRYIASTVFEPIADGGGLDGDLVLSTTGTNADVYPILYLGRDAFGLVPFKGKTSVTPMIVNPKPSDSDPLGQRGHAAWKCMSGTVILNDAFMVRGEVAVTA